MSLCFAGRYPLGSCDYVELLTGPNLLTAIVFEKESEELLMLSNHPARIPQLVKPMKKLKLQINFVCLLGMFASACSNRGGVEVI